MVKTKSTKRALLMSALALIACVSMLIGSTYAWFTDSVTSAGNKIVAGTLDVQLLMNTGAGYVDISDSNAPIFGEGSLAQNNNAETLWEPGKTQVAYLAIKNNGSLALKYKVALDVVNVAKDLYEVMEYAILPDVQYANATPWDGGNGVVPGTQAVSGDVSLAVGATHYFALAIHMKEDAGNEYQGGQVNFDLTVLATQDTVEADSFDNQYDYAADTEFVGGKGTQDEPYLINKASQLLSISDYDEYTYFKVADGVETLDMTGVGKIKLNGSFDGNGVTMNNLTTALFDYVGKSGEAQDIKISNLTANVNTIDGRALVRNIFNPGTTTFENVALHGYIEGQYNMGSFYNYGTANAGDSEGADYTVNFVNATSDVTLVCTSGNTIGGMLGHGYEGADYKLAINMDANSKYTGTMYTTTGNACYQVMAMCSHATYILNGVEVSRYDNTYPSTKLTAVTPVAEVDGYHVAPVNGVDHYVVSLEAQMTAYDENGVKIPNMAGLTWSLGKETVSTGFDGKIFDLVTSAEIVNDKNIPIGYELSNGALKVYTGRDTNYASGWITLNVTQYDAAGTILATGNVRVHTFAEP